MAEPTRSALHASLTQCFAARTVSRGPRKRRSPALLAPVVEAIAAELRTPGDRRTREPIPCVVVGLALWSLAARQADPDAALAEDKAAVARLEGLVEDVFGWKLDDLKQAGEKGIEAHELFARQYGFLDYRWDPPREDARAKPELSAKLTVLVQRPLEELVAAADPGQWGVRCGLFWSGVAAGPRSYRARLAVPGAERRVDIEPIQSKDPEVERRDAFGVVRTFAITDPRATAPAVNCQATLSIAKERGRPWATRITQEKRLRLTAATPAEAAADALSYWLQAETVCLASPPLVPTPGQPAVPARTKR